MRAVLVRIGVDHSYGEWNAPVDPKTGDFVFVPIPESQNTRFHRGMERCYDEFLPALNRFCDARDLDLRRDLGFPTPLLGASMHLDPDFECLTYGNRGNPKGGIIQNLEEDDLLVFYAGLRSIRKNDRDLVYALVGLFVVKEVCCVADIPQRRWSENAHTRKRKHCETDFVVRAKRDMSGRLARCIPIGEYRDRAYRVRKDVLKEWGGLSVKDGYIQRSAQPPRFLDPKRFSRWLSRQGAALLERNNDLDKPNVKIVHLRRPNRSDPGEMRSDPFWEFGSFGCTGCHGRTLMNPDKDADLEGARLAFAQGGPGGMRLVHLSPPVSVVRHRDGMEARWKPTEMPFRYNSAPVLIGNDGSTDFPSVKRSLEKVSRSTWQAKFSSKYRSRVRSLAPEMAEEIIQTYKALRDEVSKRDYAHTYVDALPYPPPTVDGDRSKTYRSLISPAGKNCGSRGQKKSCPGLKRSTCVKRPKPKSSSTC